MNRITFCRDRLKRRAFAARKGSLFGVALWLIGLCAGCASNVNDLLWEARRGDPESVKEAVIGLGERLREKEESGAPYERGDTEALAYLQEVAQNSQDPGNRLIAISSLGALKRAELKALFVEALSDPFWPVRLEAARALTRNPAPESAERLAKQLREETKPEVRANLIRALGQAGGDAALKATLEVLLDRSGRFRHLKLGAYDAVRALSGERHDLEDLPSWKAYYDKRFGKKATSKEAPSAPAPVSAPAGAGPRNP